ncbi:MAG: hypothetical protein KatS3mg038_1001 [Candidatus Kapaibacterium sp.]|nr:MAG: hypothetical protein KatS3mg038_1001 [Candidatus Kapabacteria bacterium]
MRIRSAPEELQRRRRVAAGLIRGIYKYFEKGSFASGQAIERASYDAFLQKPGRKVQLPKSLIALAGHVVELAPKFRAFYEAYDRWTDHYGEMKFVFKDLQKQYTKVHNQLPMDRIAQIDKPTADPSVTLHGRAYYRALRCAK